MYIYMLILSILKLNCFDFTTRHKTEVIYQLHYVFTKSDTFQKMSFEINLLDLQLISFIGIKPHLNQNGYSSDTISSFEAFKSQHGLIDFRITGDILNVVILTNYIED